MKSFPHCPVMTEEVLYWLNPKPGGLYVDCTLGAGGHSRSILEKTNGQAKILGIDWDEEALRIAKEKLNDYKHQIVLIRENFKNLPQILKEEKIEKVDGILYDLGVSSMQLDAPKRGFSFRYTAPLDMRMDTGQKLTAAHLVNQLSKKELENIFLNLGEERWARRVAEFIIQERKNHPLETTRDLVETIRKAIPAKVRQKRKIHFATKIFQALRIKVNAELENLKSGLEASFNLLQRGGRICVISYHSLEDRIVKEEFKRRKGKEICILTKKVIKPSFQEIKTNPRARSAKLRAAERI
ncbi:16S rRNA (cytosine(1402)-N(4))-methyltransferase [Candidatus Aerophobetes bacterium]|uniref:Ribosomal RNA small subunit methyltransferase H n=1 Tax=Aerophobetes bacterium TaxID=2030807 RepID=A0A662D4J8_UNCAE|nr:MAG: 16S rRNA (cytosine(1402)-N(4))-methyltransferase [Candidatus Aerophobetes bacterium]